MKKFKNDLKKYIYDMEEVKLFDSFSGIGALHSALQMLGIPTKLIGLSEIDIDAIISYAAIHIDNFLDIPFDYPSDTDIKKWLMDRNIGWDIGKQKSSIPRLKKDKLYQVYKASVLLNNFGDISLMDYAEVEDFDLFNLSFACTDISMAGKQKGFTNVDGTPTRTGLVKHGIELIKAKRPKYIMIENVKGLIQKKFIDDFYDIVNEIESYGYKCYYPTKSNGQPTCLNAKDYGIPQNRERIFIICVRKDIDDGLFTFPIGFDSGLRVKDLLESVVEDKYYLSQAIQDRFQFNGKEDFNRNELNQIGTTGADKTIGQRDRTYGVNGIVPNLTATDYKQPKQILINKECQDTNTYTTTRSYKIRKLTPKECWRLMGFTDEQFNKARATGISDSALYKQAGNSIVVNCLYYIFQELFKKYIR